MICLSPQPQRGAGPGHYCLSRAPACDADGRLQEPAIRVQSMPYLTRDIAGNPIVLQCEEPNLITPAKKLSPHKSSSGAHPHISVTYWAIDLRSAALARARRDLVAGTEIPIWSAICFVECPFICPCSITDRSEVGS
jgi:hypothetical protein